MTKNSSKSLIIEMSATSDIGTVRKENEDFHYFSKQKKFAIVCDGMGGHEKGAMASRFAGETLRDVFFAENKNKSVTLNDKSFSIKQACSDVKEKLPATSLAQLGATRLANRRILTHALLNSHMQGMGTTILSAYLTDSQLMIAHIGDSRIYRLRGDSLKCLTKDHSWLNELIEDNEISEADVKNFQKKNVLTRALGISATLKVDMHIESIKEGDLYLMCTDGLFNALEDELIKSILTANHGSLQNKVNNLVKRAKLMDGSDNITACLIHIASLSGSQDEDISEKYTINDEPENITNYLDQKAKEIYPATIEKSKNRIARKINYLGVSAVVLLVCAIVLFYLSKKDDRTGQVVQSALLGQLHPAKSKKPNEILAEIKPAGQIALIQVSDGKYIELMKTISGVKVLDSINYFNNGIPVNAGEYTWAMADANESIVYKKKSIMFQAIEDWENNAVIQNAAGHIYLLGDFEPIKYSRASVYVNNRYKGRLSQIKNTGLSIKSGQYNLEIRDSSARTILKKDNIKIKDGEIIAIEF